MHVVVTGIAQGLSFETGQAFDYITLMLPDGSRIKAHVDGTSIEKITKLFIEGGGPAAQTALAQANAEQATAYEETAAPPAAESYTRMARVGDEVAMVAPASMFAGGASEEEDEAVSTFGGDVQPNDPTLAAIGHQLQQAEGKLARAIGDTSTLSPAELHGVVARISEPEQVLPVPNVMSSKPAQSRRLSGPKVQADAMGNPIITGPGLVDPRALMGGNTDGEEDVGQL